MNNLQSFDITLKSWGEFQASSVARPDAIKLLKLQKQRWKELLELTYHDFHFPYLPIKSIMKAREFIRSLKR